jgi:hypothetical protein
MALAAVWKADFPLKEKPRGWPASVKSRNQNALAVAGADPQ